MNLFTKPKQPSMPPVPAPPAVPQPDAAVEDLTMKRAKKRSGFEQTILTGALVPTGTGKKTLLGG
jgi:hypothetical protein